MKRRVQTRKNLFGFGMPASQTTPAHGGIAVHSAKRRTKGSRSVTYRGYSIRATEEGFKTSADRGESTFDSVEDAKRFIADEIALDKRRGMKRNAPKLGSGKRFQQCVDSVKTRGGAVDPNAVCAAAGRRKYGAKKMAAMAKAGKRRKSNPAEESVQGYVDFHGRDPEEFVTVEEQVHFHRNLSGAGELISLCILPRMRKGKIDLHGFDGAILAFNEQRNQLFVKGGDQSVDLEAFGIDPRKAHERETLGEVYSVEYFTTKDHLGRQGGTANYVHKFDKRNRPDLIYRTITKHLEFSGGSYEILPEGIDR